MTMRDVDDGMIKGVIQEHRRRCDNCGVATTVIFVTDLRLRGLKPCDNMIVMKRDKTWQPETEALFRSITLLGIGCGCYGKANRQLAYMKAQYQADRFVKD
jgi:hypothetical protein